MIKISCLWNTEYNSLRRSRNILAPEGFWPVLEQISPGISRNLNIMGWGMGGYGTIYAIRGFLPSFSLSQLESLWSSKSGLIPCPSIPIPTILIPCGLSLDLCNSSYRKYNIKMEIELNEGREGGRRERVVWKYWSVPCCENTTCISVLVHDEWIAAVT